MIRLRTAFLIIIIGCAAAFFIGFETGYLSTRNNDIAKGLREWVDKMVYGSTFVVSSDKR